MRHSSRRPPQTRGTVCGNWQSRSVFCILLICIWLFGCVILAGTYRDPQLGSHNLHLSGLRAAMVRNAQQREASERSERRQNKASASATPAAPAAVGKTASVTEAAEAARLAMQKRLTQSSPDGPPIGYVKVPSFAAGEPSKDDGLLHIIFSSGCNWFQHWQSEFLLATAHMVGQRGRVTRIVSGCHDRSAETVRHGHQTFPAGKNDLLVPLEELSRSVNPNFGLYITPSFEGAKDFPWINKPSSIKYFMEHAMPELQRAGETVVAILDPDFVFLKPLSQVGSAPDDLLATRNVPKIMPDGTPSDVVVKGRPVAQRYGIEGGWVHKFDVAAMMGADSPALEYGSRAASAGFSVGPPLMLHVDDALDLSILWEKNMRPVLKKDPDILADMWAYSMAAAHLRLEHTILDQYMISTWSHHRNEGGQAFPWIDAWEHMSCRDPKPPPGKKMPNFIHLASNFKAPESKEWMFHKGHVPPDILNCDAPFIIEAPDDVYEKSEQQKTISSAWTMCHAVSRLNRVLHLYKEKYCPDGYERRYLVRLIQSKTRDRHCSQMKDKWCYPLAQIEGLPSDWRERGMGPILK